MRSRLQAAFIEHACVGKFAVYAKFDNAPNEGIARKRGWANLETSSAEDEKAATARIIQLTEQTSPGVQGSMTSTAPRPRSGASEN